MAPSTRSVRRPGTALAAAAVLLLSAACGTSVSSADPAGQPPEDAAATSTSSSTPSTEQSSRLSSAEARVPGLRVSTRVRGLSHPWDVKPIGDGRLLITEREPARLTVAGRGGARRTVAFPTSSVWQAGETGLMGLETDPGFARNGRFYTCSGWNTAGGGHDVRVNAWRMNDAATRATLVEPLVTGLPTSTGRHGGCRLLLTTNGALIVGTGDAAVGTNPRNLGSLGGKTLRLDPRTGAPWPKNQFIKASNRKKRYVLTFGHRNVQGLAQRADGTLWSAEHGPDRDDEVNRLIAGGDYGWNPVPGYNEDVPMTDQSLPGKQVPARWRSGSRTVASSGADFVSGGRWGALDGTLAVAALRDEKVLFLTFGAKGSLQRVTVPKALTTYGRLRTVTSLGRGTILVATDGADGAGRILQVQPR